jgi:hypothetical protein
MANEQEPTITPETDESIAAKAAQSKQMERIANEAADRLRKTERRYDQQHGSFPRGGPSGMA